MDSNTDLSKIKAGKIEVRAGKKGIEFFAWNFQRRKILSIGTVQSAVYEKVAPVLEKPERSFALTQSEFAAVQEAGASIIRIILPGRAGTYAIGVQDFQMYAQPHYHVNYGPQMRCALTKFQYSPRVVKRNSILDNPPLSQVRLIVKEKQLSMFERVG